jgi:hypothetical protein
MSSHPAGCRRYLGRHDWATLYPVIKQLFDEGKNGAEIYEAAVALGYSGIQGSLMVQMRRWKLFLRGPAPRIREKTERDRRPKANRSNLRGLGLEPVYDDTKRYIAPRPVLDRGVMTLTARLLGDPPPGRTPWA